MGIGPRLDAQRARVGVVARRMQQRPVADVDGRIHAVAGGAGVRLGEQRADAAQRHGGRLQVGGVLALVENVLRADRDVDGRDLRAVADVDPCIARSGVVRERAAARSEPDGQGVGARVLRLRVERAQVDGAGVDHRTGADHHLGGLVAVGARIGAGDRDRTAAGRLSLDAQRVAVDRLHLDEVRAVDVRAVVEPGDDFLDVDAVVICADAGGGLHAADRNAAHRHAEALGVAGIDGRRKDLRVVIGRHVRRAAQARGHRARHVGMRIIEGHREQAAGQRRGAGVRVVHRIGFDEQRVAVDAALDMRFRAADRVGFRAGQADADEAAAQAGGRGIRRVRAVGGDLYCLVGAERGMRGRVGLDVRIALRPGDRARGAEQRAARARKGLGFRAAVRLAIVVRGAHGEVAAGGGNAGVVADVGVHGW